VHEDLERRLAAARERVGELSRGLGRDNLDAWRAAREDQLKAERDLASACGEQSEVPFRRLHRRSRSRERSPSSIAYQ
jgi:hypothetical protein